MTAAELDAAYTQLCKTMSGLGEERSGLFLGRFALLAMTRIGDLAAVERLIAESAEDLIESAP